MARFHARKSICGLPGRLTEYISDYYSGAVKEKTIRKRRLSTSDRISHTEKLKKNKLLGKEIGIKKHSKQTK